MTKYFTQLTTDEVKFDDGCLSFVVKNGRFIEINYELDDKVHATFRSNDNNPDEQILINNKIYMHKDSDDLNDISVVRCETEDWLYIYDGIVNEEIICCINVNRNIIHYHNNLSDDDECIFRCQDIYKIAQKGCMVAVWPIDTQLAMFAEDLLKHVKFDSNRKMYFDLIKISKLSNDDYDSINYFDFRKDYIQLPFAGKRTKSARK